MHDLSALSLLHGSGSGTVGVLLDDVIHALLFFLAKVLKTLMVGLVLLRGVVVQVILSGNILTFLNAL